MKRLSIYITIVTMVFSACSSTSTLYDSDYILTKIQAKSATTDLTVYVPYGWFTSETNDNQFIDLWLTKNNYSASIIFLPIHFDVNNIPDDDYAMKRIYDLVKVKSESEGNTNLTANQIIEFSGTSALAFEFVNVNHERCRTVIFHYNDQYFHCTAAILNSEITPDELFTVQNSVLNSLFASK